VPGIAAGDGLDHDLPGFGPFGTAGAHCFDPTHPVYVRVSAIARLRRAQPVLRAGRQYLRPISVFGEAFAPSRPGEVLAWSRILVDEEALCAVNPNGLASRGADVVVDASLNPAGSSLTVVASSTEAAGLPDGHRVGRRAAGAAPGRRHRVRGPAGPGPERDAGDPPITYWAAPRTAAAVPATFPCRLSAMAGVLGKDRPADDTTRNSGIEKPSRPPNPVAAVTTRLVAPVNASSTATDTTWTGPNRRTRTGFSWVMAIIPRRWR
jgi:hypothetical protein